VRCTAVGERRRRPATDERRSCVDPLVVLEGIDHQDWRILASGDLGDADRRAGLAKLGRLTGLDRGGLNVHHERKTKSKAY